MSHIKNLSKWKRERNREERNRAEWKGGRDESIFTVHTQTIQLLSSVFFNAGSSQALASVASL